MSMPSTDSAGFPHPGGASWRTSSYSQDGGACVEAAFLPDGGVALRDSKAPDGPVLRYTRPEGKRATRGVKGGEFDAA